jgi:hypothetical protein
MIAFCVAYQLLTLISVITWNGTENPAKYPIDMAVNDIVTLLGIIVTSYFGFTGIRVMHFFTTAKMEMFNAVLIRVCYVLNLRFFNHFKLFWIVVALAVILIILFTLGFLVIANALQVTSVMHSYWNHFGLLCLSFVHIISFVVPSTGAISGSPIGPIN